MLNGIKHTQEFMLNEFKTVKQNNTEIGKQNLQVLVVSFVRRDVSEFKTQMLPDGGRLWCK